MSESVLSRPASEPDDVLTWGPEPGQVADLRLGSPDQPLAIVIHGGFWRPRTDRTHLRPMAHALAEAGYTVLSPEYRRISGDPDVTMDDIRVGLQVLPTAVHGYFNERVILMGHSVGGHLALWAAAICPPPGLIATIASSPVGDLQAADRANLGRGAVRDFLGMAADERPDLDPARLPRPDTRTIVLAGSLDDEVPTAISQAYVQAHEGIESHVLAGVGHYEFIDPLSDVWTVILTTLAAVAQG